MQHKQNTLYIKFCIPQIQILQHVKFTVRDARGQWHKKRSCFHDGQNISKNYILGGKAEGRGEGSMAGGGGGPMSGLHCVHSTEHLRDRLWILKRHFWKACLNFGKARCLWYAEKLFWFIAKILEFDIYRSSASNEDFLESWWRRKCSILNFPPLEYVSDFEPGSHADQWQWS